VTSDRKGKRVIRFEYDENQSRINKEKHGIDFEMAKELWKDEFRVVRKVDMTKISAEEFDRIFDEGGDIFPFLDLDTEYDDVPDVSDEYQEKDDPDEESRIVRRQIEVDW
jgi:hypothetical protein